MFTGVLIDNRVDSRDISAGIIYLAQQGFIAIKQIDTESISLFKKPDYEITLRRPINEAPSDLDRSLLELFFASSDQTRGTGQVHSAVLLSSVKRKKAEGTVTRVNVLKDRLKHELVGLGLLEQGFKKILVTVCFSIIAIWMYFMSDPSVSELTSFYTLLISIILISVFATERRTREGYAALHYLKGFKLFLTVTEEDRYKLLNAPALSPQQFMEYLPYAVAFGVEKEWANVFKDMQIDDPTWYSSRSPARLDAPLLTSLSGYFF